MTDLEELAQDHEDECKHSKVDSKYCLCALNNAYSFLAGAKAGLLRAAEIVDDEADHFKAKKNSVDKENLVIAKTINILSNYIRNEAEKLGEGKR